MFDDLKPGDQTGFIGSKENSGLPAKPASPLMPTEDMLADVDPMDKPSAVQSGLITPVSKGPLPAAPLSATPLVKENLSPDAINNEVALGRASDNGGGGFKKALLVIIGVGLAGGIAFGAYTLWGDRLSFEMPDNSNSNIDNTNTANVPTNGIIENTTNIVIPPENVLEPDSDADGLTDAQEIELGTNPFEPDTDNDGLFDKEEVEIYKTNPLSSDTDNDGLSDYYEVTRWFTDPNNPDTDGDGYSDGMEVENNYNPLGPGDISQWRIPLPLGD